MFDQRLERRVLGGESDVRVFAGGRGDEVGFGEEGGEFEGLNGDFDVRELEGLGFGVGHCAGGGFSEFVDGALSEDADKVLAGVGGFGLEQRGDDS